MKLALGTAQFGMDYGVANHAGKVPRAEVAAILRLAIASGIDTLDTAIAYGNSEQCLGEVGVAGWNVITKLPPVPHDCVDVTQWASLQLTDSLARLHVGRVHALLVHRSEDLLGAHGARLVDALSGMKRDGLVDQLGASIYAPTLLPELFSRIHLDLVQAPFNVIDRRLQASGWLAELKRRGTRLHVRSAFMQGLLLMNRDERPPKFAAWDELWEQWHFWLESSSQTATTACLGFLNQFPEIDRIVVGVDCAQQLEELVAASNNEGMIVPEQIQSHDGNLLDPSRWGRL